MNEQELCRKRLLDLSRQADRKGIVLFSDFLNLNEQNIFHSLQKELYTTAELSGGYEQAERQMVAFIPDALCYEYFYPMKTVIIEPLNLNFSESLTHRDYLGALMNLGIERSRMGDILIDGGNSHFPDTIRRTAYVESKGKLYIGTGVSGGEEGALKGPSMMPGGSPAAWPYVKPIFQSICAKVEAARRAATGSAKTVQDIS